MATSPHCHWPELIPKDTTPWPERLGNEAQLCAQERQNGFGDVSSVCHVSQITQVMEGGEEAPEK